MLDLILSTRKRAASFSVAGGAALVLGLALGGVLSGCGGAAASPAKSVGDERLDSVGDALGALDRAEDELLAALGERLESEQAQQGYPPPQPGQAAPTYAQPAPPPPPAEPEALAAEGGDADGLGDAPSSRCTVACRALGSMDRAAERLCELSGEEDDRCVAARERVAIAHDRVEASCPTCGES
jgi:hypothetical protein